MARRRGKGEGSVFKRKDGRWEAQATVGFNPQTGTMRRKSYYGKTRKEAVEKMQKVINEIHAGVYVEPTTILFEEWLEKWLVHYKKGQLKPSTYESYERLLKAHIKPSLGKIPMAKLQANILQVFYNDKLENGRCDGKGGLSTRMVRHLHTVIRQALQQAVKEGLLSRNVADSTSPPVVRNKQIMPLTEKQLLLFLETAKVDKYYPAFVLCAFTGLRRGELLGLCWDCVDLDNGVITVTRQLVPLKTGLELDETTKSKSGRRSVVLTDDTLKELKAYKERQDELKEILGRYDEKTNPNGFQDRDLVFCRDDGTFLDPIEFTKRFQRYLEKAQLPKVRLHDLRHTHASLLLARGVHPKIVQERLGHSSISMTLDLYSHLAPGLQEKAAASLNGFLGGKRSDTTMEF